MCVVLFVPQLLSYPFLARDIRKGPRNFYLSFSTHTHDTALFSISLLHSSIKQSVYIFFLRQIVFFFIFFVRKLTVFTFTPQLFVCSSVFSSTVSLFFRVGRRILELEYVFGNSYSSTVSLQKSKYSVRVVVMSKNNSVLPWWNPNYMGCSFLSLSDCSMFVSS